jgi:GMP synthase-like glutamine amidotransferase
LIGLCLGAPVARAPQGWGAGRMTYDWHRRDLPHSATRDSIALLASHQDQVLALPAGATLVASSDFCPVAAFTVGSTVFCIQPHPEFDVGLSAHLINKRRDLLGADLHRVSLNSLADCHEGAHIARLLVAFLEGEDAVHP